MTESFVATCLDALSAVGSVRARAMFGGHGIYSRDVMFALVADDVLYMKVDDQTRGAFENAGSVPFIYYAKKGSPATMSYWEMPPEGFESSDRARHWAQLALEAASRTKR